MSNHECYMKEKIESIEKKIDKISDALLGDEFREDGIISQVDKHEKYIDADKRLKWIIYGGIIVVTALIQILPYLIKFFKLRTYQNM